ncbi:MAG: hypothetical protein ABGX47_08850 [Martelella sp.]|uniref:hypothetical protein n=1 Tax=Martelella sp. TaxID=1969699 RepID=UPI003242FEFF
MIDPFHADKLTGMPQKQRGVKNLVMMMKNHLDAEMPCCDPVGLRDNHRPLGTEGRLKRLMELGEIAPRLRAAALQAADGSDNQKRIRILCIHRRVRRNPDIAFAILRSDEAGCARRVLKLAPKLVDQEIDVTIAAGLALPAENREQIIAAEQAPVIGRKMLQQNSFLPCECQSPTVPIAVSRQEIL